MTPEGGNSPEWTSVMQPQGTGFYRQQNEQEMESPQDFQRGAQPGPHLGFSPVRLSDFWPPELSETRLCYFNHQAGGHWFYSNRKRMHS